MCVYNVDLSLCDFLGKPDVIFGDFPLTGLNISYCCYFISKKHIHPFLKQLTEY